MPTVEYLQSIGIAEDDEAFSGCFLHTKTLTQWTNGENLFWYGTGNSVIDTDWHPHGREFHPILHELTANTNVKNL